MEVEHGTRTLLLLQAEFKGNPWGILEDNDTQVEVSLMGFQRGIVSLQELVQVGPWNALAENLVTLCPFLENVNVVESTDGRVICWVERS